MSFDDKFFEATRHQMAKALLDFLETDLSLVATFLDIAQLRYQRGALSDADRAKTAASRGIETIRYFLSTTDLLSLAIKDQLASRCDELAQRLASTPTNPT